MIKPFRTVSIQGNTERFRVRITEDCIARAAGKLPAQYSKGDEISVDRESYDELLAAGRIELVEGPAAKPQGKKPEDAFAPALPERPRVKRREVPDDVRKLPEPFVKLWRLWQETRCLSEEHELAVKMLPSIPGGAGPFDYAAFVGHTEVENESSRVRLVRSFIAEIEDEIAAFDAEKFWALKSRCAEITTKEIEAVNAIIAEARKMAFEAFKVRLGPLGLHESKQRDLYTGSALYLRFEQAPNVPNLNRCLDGAGGFFVDEPSPTIIRRYISATKRKPQAEALLGEAKKELANARKAMGKL